jgi:hypothetical protein
MPYTIIISKAGKPPLFGPVLVASAGEARAILLDELARHAETLQAKGGAVAQALVTTQRAMEELRQHNLATNYRVYLASGKGEAAIPLAFQIFVSDDEVSNTAEKDLMNTPKVPFLSSIPDDVD